jgi:hypothetical protein
MSVLSKFVRKNKKALLTGLRVVAAGVTRGKSEKIVSNLKGIGAAVKVYKGLTKRPSKSESAQQAKLNSVHVTPPRIVPISAVQATTMPGGKKLSGVPTFSGSSKRAPVAVVKVKGRKRAAAKAKAPRKASSGKRAAPKGGKDFKALSVSWNAAGKPGTWLAWVKAH